MYFALSDEQQVLQRTAAELSAQLFPDSSVRDSSQDGGALRSRAWSMLTGLDLVGLLVPEEQGGAGGSVVDACVVAEVLGQHLAPVPYVGTAIAAAAFLRFADGPKEELAGLSRGAGYSVLLDGRLTGASSEATVAFDWTAGSRGVVLSPEGRAEVCELANPIPFDDIDPLHPLCRVAPVATTTVAGEGARRARAAAWSGAAALLTGLADGALKEAVAYAKQREQYGRPIGSFQAVQHLCADMLFEVETSRSITYGAAWSVEHASIEEAESLAATAKAHAGSAAIRACETGIQVLGGIGVTQEHDAHLRLRSAHLHNAFLGGTDAPLLLLADAVLARTT